MTCNISFPDAIFANDSSGTRRLFLKKRWNKKTFFLKKGGTRRLNKHRCRDTGVMENTAYW
jgi:hypothetical protein